LSAATLASDFCFWVRAFSRACAISFRIQTQTVGVDVDFG
jgi:hypothetical protein